MAWVFLILAGIMEMCGIIAMRFTEGFTKWKPTLVCIVVGFCSFYFLSRALQEIPIGTAYGIWTGIGAAGAVILGMMFFNEKRSMLKLLMVACIVIGVAGLKATA